LADLFETSHVVSYITPGQNARGLAHSKTLRVIRESLVIAPASWTAAALRRFSPPFILHSLRAKPLYIYSLHRKSAVRPSLLA
ncbi:MAG TPA: hypothetical protein VGF90_03985, partial [Verrucomicrobiae bacterium]